MVKKLESTTSKINNSEKQEDYATGWEKDCLLMQDDNGETVCVFDINEKKEKEVK